MATINDLGIPGTNSGILQPKLSNKWSITFAGLGTSTTGGTNVTVQATDVDRPSITFDKVPLHRYNSVAYVAGKHSWKPLSLDVQDDVTNLASKVIQQQIDKQQKLIGSTSVQFLPTAQAGNNYKFVTYLNCYDGADKIIEKWIVEGCFIESADYGKLDYSKSEPVSIKLSILFDHARQVHVDNVSLGSALGGSGGN